MREAEHWLRTGGAEVSASTIAARVGVSLRSLEMGSPRRHRRRFAGADSVKWPAQRISLRKDSSVSGLIISESNPAAVAFA